MALGLSQPLLAFFHLVTHAMFKALLFICAGNIIHCKQNNQDLRLMGNIWSSMPVTCTAINVANVALCGLPFMAGFYSKDIIVETFIFTNHPISTGFMLMLRVILTSFYSIRLRFYTLWSPIKSQRRRALNDERICIYVPCLVLLSGAITRGAVITWAVVPRLNIISLPLLIKIIALRLIVFLGFCRYRIVSRNKILPGGHFCSSMWFLSYLTSSPLVGNRMKVRKIFSVNELTWLEILRGKATMRVIKKLSLNFQIAQGFRFSQLFSLISCVLILGLVIF